MDISEVARKSGVAASALRYYERKGLIRSLESEGARRKFAPAVLDQLALIALGLRHAAACPAPSHAACPLFQRLLQGSPQHRAGLPTHRTPHADYDPTQVNDPAALTSPAPLYRAHFG